MIRTFRHRGLQRLFERGDRSKVRTDQADKIRRILQRLEASRSIEEVDGPGLQAESVERRSQRFPGRERIGQLADHLSL